MTRRRVLIGGGLVGIIVAVALAWWLGSPLFRDTVVDEAFPFELPEPAAMETMTEEEKQEMVADFEAAMPTLMEIEALAEADRMVVQERVMEAAAAMPDTVMDEPMPAMPEPEATPTPQPEATPAPQPEAAPQPELLREGQFRGADDFHRGSGQAMIFRTPDDKLVLRLTDFMVTNGPALSVLLSSSPAPASSQQLGDYIDVGALKGNIGNQNYEIPAGTDLSTYNSVVIYCVPFRVVFATATLPA
ncbi:MAG: DM13 domain-containing protein [Chloroflexi bacterium]|nr:DM13 domain-containing protein [Chloroflexota bacterium]